MVEHSAVNRRVVGSSPTCGATTKSRLFNTPLENTPVPARCATPRLKSIAQTAQFEVASVKPAPPDVREIRCTGGPGTSDPGSLTCENYSLSFLVMMAYNLRSFQLTAPAWMDTARFNVVAKIPPGTATRQFGLMLQRLLAERWRLQVHFEKMDMTVYELTVAKGGPKFKESQEPPATERPEAAWRPPAFGPP